MQTGVKHDSIAVVSIGDWLVDPNDNSIRRGRDRRVLQPLSMSILLYLAERPMQVVTSRTLIDTFWVGRVVGDDAVHRRIADLRKNLDDDAKDPRYIETIPKRGYRLLAKAGQPSAVNTAHSGRWRIALIAAAVVLAIGTGLLVSNTSRRHEALEAALSQAGTALAADNYQAAYAALGPHTQERDPRVTLLLDKVLLPATIVTDPDGVDVSYRYSEADSDWISLGKTPVTGKLLPKGHYKLRFGGAVYMDASHPGATLNSAGRAERVIEMPGEAVPDDMVYIPSGRYRLGAWGFTDDIDLGGFLLDRREVSNRDYRDFVDAGGYAEPRYWQTLIDASAGRLTWELIRDQFVDRTGYPGPADWELGSYLSGDDALPVVGVSWYEASAYLAFRNKTLPSVQHWLRATLGPLEWKYPFAQNLVPRSNVDAVTLLPVTRDSAAEVSGAYDLIGNAAEWTASDSQGAKAAIGSSFRDPAWDYNFPHPDEPTSRNATVGFRGMRYSETSYRGPLPGFDLFQDFAAATRHVPDAVFEGMRNTYSYTEGTIRSGDVHEIARTEADYWIRVQLAFPTGRDGDSMPVYVYLPRRHSPPYQSVIYLPPADSWSPGFRSDSISLENYQIDFIPRSGRALIWPVYSGSNERYDGFLAATAAARGTLALERNRHIRDEIGRVIDYLAIDPMFDGDRVALMGLSHGAILSPFTLATEPRIKAAVLYSVGLAPPIPLFANPLNDPNVFWARVSQPILIMNGRYDLIRPQRFVLQPLLDLLATPAEDKAAIVYESGHWPLPRYQMMRDSLSWLDRYLGPAPPPAIEFD